MDEEEQAGEEKQEREGGPPRPVPPPPPPPDPPPAGQAEAEVVQEPPALFPSFTEMLVAGLREECQRLRLAMAETGRTMRELPGRCLAGLAGLAQALRQSASAMPGAEAGLGAIQRLVEAVAERVRKVPPAQAGEEPEPLPAEGASLDALQAFQDRLREANSSLAARDLELRVRLVKEVLPVEGAVVRFLREGAVAQQAAAQGVRALAAVLAALGAVRVESLHRRFTPEVHSAESQVAVADPEQDELIVSVSEEGYFVRDRLVRPARVVVGVYEAEEPPPAREAR